MISWLFFIHKILGAQADANAEEDNRDMRHRAEFEMPCNTR